MYILLCFFASAEFWRLFIVSLLCVCWILGRVLQFRKDCNIIEHLSYIVINLKNMPKNTPSPFFLLSLVSLDFQCWKEYALCFFCFCFIYLLFLLWLLKSWIPVVYDNRDKCNNRFTSCCHKLSQYVQYKIVRDTIKNKHEIISRVIFPGVK